VICQPGLCASYRPDLLPNELAGDIAAMIEQGMRVMKPTLERP
jgi:hypothetical protein